MANNIIKMNRGDTYEFDLTILDDDGNQYVLSGDDKVYFGLMEPNAPFEESIVRKVISADDPSEENGTAWTFDSNTGSMTIIMQPSDTAKLLPGLYYYTVKLEMDHTVTLDSGEEQDVYKVATIINKTKFILLD